MTAVSGGVERQLNRPIVRQIDDAPIGVGEPLRGGAGTGPGIFQMQRIRPVIAEVEFPVRVEQEVFARRTSGRELRDQQRGAHAGEESAEQ